MRTEKPSRVPFARKALRAVLALVLAVGLAPSAPAFADEAAPAEAAAQALGYMGFPDVDEGDWYATDDMLGYAVDNGLLAGYDDGRFGPYDTVTRAQVATVLWRVAGEPEADADDFADVDYSQWYGAPIEWARSTGVVSGYGDTNTFDPEGAVTREQLAVMLSNYAVKVAGLDASSDCAGLDAINGAGGVSPWAREQMGWAVDEGILSGVVVDGVAWVDPQGTAQRCQVAKMASVFHRDVLGLGSSVDYVDDVVQAGSGASVSEDGTAAEIPSSSGEVSVGDVVVVEPTDENPKGAAIKVQSVDRRQDGSSSVSGRQAELGEIVDELHVEGSSSRIVSFEAADGVDVVDGRTGEASALASFDDSTTLADMTFKIGEQGTLSLDASVDYAIDFSGGAISLIDLSIDTDAGFKWHYAASVGEKDRKIGTATFATSVPGVTIGADFYVTYTAAGEVTLEARASADAGVRYEGGSWDSWASKDFDFNASFDGTAQIAAEPAIVLEFLGAGVVDASVEVGGMAEGALNVRTTGLVCADLDAWLYVQFCVGQHDSLANALGLSKVYNLVGKGNGPRVREHLEDGNPVPECTWGEVGGGDGDFGDGTTSTGSDESYRPEYEDNGYGTVPVFADIYEHGNILAEPFNVNEGTAVNIGFTDDFSFFYSAPMGTVWRYTYTRSDGVTKSFIKEGPASGSPVRVDCSCTIEVLCGRLTLKKINATPGTSVQLSQCDVVPYPLHISNEKVVLKRGETFQLDAWHDIDDLGLSLTGTEEPYRFVWDVVPWSKCVDVDRDTGLITAKEPGTATVKLTLAGYIDHFERICEVTVV